MVKENFKTIIGVAALLAADLGCQIQGPNNTSIYADAKVGRSNHGVWTSISLYAGQEVYLFNGELAPGSDCSNAVFEQGKDMGGATAFDSSKTRQSGKFCP